MEPLQVDATGLRQLAIQAEGLATELEGSSPQVVGGNSWQPSCVAVNVVGAGIDNVAHALAGRMTMAAANLMASSSAYAAQDARAASTIRAA